ncbi:hypothetical protein Q0812_13455 [Brevundimonas sp. 2R-24]|uniref:Uncharacterized protein n=1 Tax=Peiella sedimenti TaxID=3061083 RepID=A0ABT8SPM0_9CAUL|nr:hypothetical protein [Caulobacteraceae bacterium XZ-24]
MTRILPLRTILMLAAAVAAVILLLAWCGARKDAREARNDQTMAEGRTVSAVEAIREINELEARGDAGAVELEQAHEAIRQADPADRNAVARRQLCRLQHRTDCDRMQ